MVHVQDYVPGEHISWIAVAILVLVAFLVMGLFLLLVSKSGYDDPGENGNEDR